MTANTVEEDNCGEYHLCVEACPYGAINNTNWRIGVKRNELFNAHICNEKRLEHIPEFGRKNACGLCLQACPVGRIQ